MRIRSILLAIAAILCFSTTAHTQVAPFHNGDRVTFVGNSITDGGHYHSYIWLYYMTRFPNMPVWMANCGVGGDTAGHIFARLDDDVFAKGPTVITLSFGMNDTGYFEYNGDDAETFGNQKVEEAKQQFLKIEQRLKEKPDTRIVLIGTSPYDHTSRFNNDVFRNKNNYMRRIVALQDSVAKANNWGFVDFNQPMWDINQQFQSIDSTFTLIGSDRVHPDNDGHMVMAYLFLKAQGMAGKPVAEVSVDARKGKCISCNNCTISNISSQAGALSFDYQAEALPFPLDTIAHGWMMTRPQSLINKYIPSFMEEMNREALQVKGLKGNYLLRIDEIDIDTIDAEQLAKGINLAEYRHTPQYQQACAIMSLNEHRWELERKFRDYAWLQYNFFLKKGLLNVHTEHSARVFREGQSDAWVASKKEIYDQMHHPAVRQQYTDEMNLLVRRIYELNKPITRHFTLTPIR